MRKLFSSILWAALLTFVVFGVAAAQTEPQSPFDVVYVERINDPYQIHLAVRCGGYTAVTVDYGDGNVPVHMLCNQNGWLEAIHNYAVSGAVDEYFMVIWVGTETHYVTVQVGSPLKPFAFMAWYSVPDATKPNEIVLRANNCITGLQPHVEVAFGDGGNTTSHCDSYMASATAHAYLYWGKAVSYTASLHEADTTNVVSVVVNIPAAQLPEPEPTEPLTVTVTLNLGSPNSGAVNISNCVPDSWHTVLFGDGDGTDSQCNAEGKTSAAHDWPWDGNAITYTITVDAIYTRTLVLPGRAVDPGPDPDPVDGFDLDLTQDPEMFNRFRFEITGADEYDYIRILFGDGSQTDAAIQSDGTAMVPHDYPIGVEPKEFYWSAGVIGEDPSYLGIITIIPSDPGEPEPPIQKSVKIEVDQVGTTNHVDFRITNCVAGMFYPLDFGDQSKTDVLCESDGTATVPHDYPWSWEVTTYYWLLGTPNSILGAGVVHVGEVEQEIFLPLVTN